MQSTPGRQVSYKPFTVQSHLCTPVCDNPEFATIRKKWQRTYLQKLSVLGPLYIVLANVACYSISTD